MGISLLAPLAGAALGATALEGVRRLGSALSFAEVLGGGSASQASPVQSPAPADLSGFLQRLLPQLASAGVDTSRPLTLRVTSRGTIQVEGEHPDRAEVEGLFLRDSELTDQFRRLATQAGAQQLRLQGQAATWER